MPPPGKQKKLISILFSFLRVRRHCHMRYKTGMERWRMCCSSTEGRCRSSSGQEGTPCRRPLSMVCRWRRPLCMVWPRRLCRAQGRRGGTRSWRPPTHTRTRPVGLLECLVAHLLALILEGRLSGKPRSPKPRRYALLAPPCKPMSPVPYSSHNSQTPQECGGK